LVEEQDCEELIPEFLPTDFVKMMVGLQHQQKGHQDAETQYPLESDPKTLADENPFNVPVDALWTVLPVSGTLPLVNCWEIIVHICFWIPFGGLPALYGYRDRTESLSIVSSTYQPVTRADRLLDRFPLEKTAWNLLFNLLIEQSSALASTVSRNSRLGQPVHCQVTRLLYTAVLSPDSGWSFLSRSTSKVIL
jgi:hypothetical protein